jgi:hypothetical protein
MKTIALFSALALGTLTSAALAATPTTTVPSQQAGRVELNDTQMDTLKAGENYGYHYVYNNSGHTNSSYTGKNDSQYHCYNNC